MNYGSLHLDIVFKSEKSYLFIKDSMMLTKYEIFAKKKCLNWIKVMFKK